MQNKDILLLAITAGKIMLESGAETYRVEDTMNRMTNHLGIETEVFVTTTGVFISDGEQTLLKRISKRTIHLDKVARVNDISRKISNKELSIDEIHPLLTEIDNLSPYPKIIRTIAIGSCCASFTLLFGGGFFDAINGFITGMMLNIVSVRLSNNDVSSFISTMLGSACVTLCAISLYYLGLGTKIDSIIIAGIMPLLPGMRLTNAIRDVLQGDHLSASGRIFESLTVSISLAVGVGFILKIWLLIIGGDIL